MPTAQPYAMPYGYLLVKGILMAIPMLIRIFLPYGVIVGAILYLKWRFANGHNATASRRADERHRREPIHGSSARARQAPPPENPSQQDRVPRAVCSLCGKPLSEAVENYCRDHDKVFDGRGYCFEHQKVARANARAVAPE